MLNEDELTVIDKRELGNIQLLNSEVSLASFKQYLYTGKIKDIEKNENSLEDSLLDLIVLASHFDISELQYAVTNYLESIISADNVCYIFSLSQNSTLREYCLMYMDLHASSIIEQKKYRELKAEQLVYLLRRDTFDVAETKIFAVVKDWHTHNNQNYIKHVVDCIRFPLLGREFVKSEVKDSGMLNAEELIDVFTALLDNSAHLFRGTLLVDTNLALDDMGADLIKGNEYRHNLLGDYTNERYQVQDSGYTSHTISDNYTNSILIELEKTFIINHIVLRLYDLNQRYDVISLFIYICKSQNIDSGKI